MAKREVREVHTSSGGGGIGILGVIIGALLVIGAVAFYANESGMFASKSNSGPSVTVNAPSAPSAPAAPSAPRAPATTTGSGSTSR